MTLSAGKLLGPYEILSLVGSGGMGEVYRARDTRLSRTVAVKTLTTQVAHRSDLKARFEREARTLATLSHPHICTVFDVGRHDGVDYLVMEYLEGQTLAQRLQGNALSLNETLNLAIQLADALDKAHRQNIVHRDLKPGNIVLTKSGAKIVDFGLAKLVEDGRGPIGAAGLSTHTPMTAEGTILGTMQYMAPEQLEAKEADARTDIFAFGAIVYEMVDRPAFVRRQQPGESDRGDPRSRSPRDVNPPTIDAIVAGARHPEMPCKGSGRSMAVRRRSARRTQMDRRRHARRHGAHDRG